MSAALIRLCIVALAILVPVVLWSERTAPVDAQRLAAHSPQGLESDASEDASEKLATADDAAEARPAPGLSQVTSPGEPREWRHRWRAGLSAGRPASSAPFKPPRA